MSRLEARLAAELRVLHEELAAVKQQLSARSAPTVFPAAAPPAAKSTSRRSLGRGLDALMRPSPTAWWHEGVFPDPTRPPGEPPSNRK